jgi:DNA-binding LacI/PurR family transcriptional regulator
VTTRPASASAPIPGSSAATGAARAVRPSLKTVATAARVSIATASLALRNSPRCAAKTRQRVARIAARLGYSPDPQIAKLMSYLHRPGGDKDGATLCYLTAFPERDGWRGLHTWEKYYAGARQRAGELGYRLEEFWLRAPGMSEQRLSNILLSRGITGVLVAPLPWEISRLALDWHRFATVAIGFSLQKPQVHRVAHDHFFSMVAALQRIHQQGYQRVGLAMSPAHDQRVARHWTAAYLAEQKAGGAAPLEICDNPSQPEQLVAWFRRTRPEVVVSDMLAVARGLERAGWKVPHDFAFVHLNLPCDGQELAGVDQHSQRVGEAAVKQLVAAMHQNEVGLPHLPATTLVRGEWVEGHSLPPKSRASAQRVAIARLWAEVSDRVEARGKSTFAATGAAL